MLLCMDNEENYPDRSARRFFFSNDEILLVFDFELSVQGKITFIGLCTHTPPMKYWRALDFPQNSSLFLICL